MSLPNFKKVDDKGTSKSIRRQALKRIDKKWEGRKVKGPALTKALRNKMSDADKHIKRHELMMKKEGSEGHHDEFKARFDKFAKWHKDKQQGK